jgi:hypothetical protein
MLAFVLVLLIVRLIAGAITRLLVPGRDPAGILATIARRPDRPVADAIVLLLRLAGNAAATTPQPVPAIAD